MFNRRKWRRTSLITIALLGLTTATAGVAQADQFTQTNTAPTVASPVLSATIQPNAGASTAVYSYAVVVGDAETLNDLSTITVCLYLTTGGDSTCASPNPTSDVKLVWTQSTNTFSIVNGSANPYWVLGVSPNQSTAPALTGVSGTFTFKFKVSEAMREGGWTAAVTVDDGLATVSNSAATTTVLFYGAVTTRVSQNFGTVTPGLATGVVSTASPTVTSNGQTTYSMTSGTFVNGSYNFTLETGLPSAAPGVGEVSFDCQVASTFTEASATRVLSTSTQISAAQTPTGTPELGSAVDNSCRLAHGGQRPIGTYSFSVVNAVGNG